MYPVNREKNSKIPFKVEHDGNRGDMFDKKEPGLKFTAFSKARNAQFI